MKRLLCILCLIAVVTACVGCNKNDPPSSTVSYALGRFAGATSARITATCEGIPLLGSTTVTYDIDGHIHRVGETLFSDELYMEMLPDGSQALYTKNGKTWKRDVLRIAEQEKVPSFIAEDRLRPIFDTTLYEAIPDQDGNYRLREDVTLPDISDLRLTIGADFCKFTLTATIDGRALDLTLLFTEIGAVALTLPQTS